MNVSVGDLTGGCWSEKEEKGRKDGGRRKELKEGKREAGVKVMDGLQGYTSSTALELEDGVDS